MQHKNNLGQKQPAAFFLDILFPLNISDNDRAAVGFPVCTKWDIPGPATPDWSEEKLPKRMF